MMGSVSLINGHIDDDITDEQIIKALEWHSNDETHCSACPYEEYSVTHYCVDMVMKDALDLINRQKAEIERLRKCCGIITEEDENWYPSPLKTPEEIRAEAVKEFAEAYKDQIEDCTGMFTDEGFYVPLDAVLNAVDFIRERLVGDTDV